MKTIYEYNRSGGITKQMLLPILTIKSLTTPGSSMYVHVSLSCNSHGVPNMIVSVELSAPHGGFEATHVYTPSALSVIELIICGEETDVPPGVIIKVEPLVVHVIVTSSPGKGQRSKIPEGAPDLEQPSSVPRPEIVPTKESIEGLAVKQIYIHHTLTNK